MAGAVTVLAEPGPRHRRPPLKRETLVRRRVVVRLVSGLAISLCCLAVASSCWFGPDSPTKILVRVRNASDLHFSNVRLSYPPLDQHGTSVAVEFGALSPGEESVYFEVPHAYRFGRYDVETADFTQTLGPPSFAADDRLEPARYT